MRIVIGHIALIQRLKKQDFVLQVIGELRKRGHDAVGLFPGECREREFMQELNEMTENLGLAEAVLFLGRRNDIPDLLKLFDVLIIPSCEGFPLAGLEAASAGVPVAVCDLAGAQEFVRVSNGGKTFEADNVMAAADAVIACCGNKMLAANGRAFAEKATTDVFKMRIKNCFASVSNENARRGS